MLAHGLRFKIVSWDVSTSVSSPFPAPSGMSSGSGSCGLGLSHPRRQHVLRIRTVCCTGIVKRSHFGVATVARFSRIAGAGQRRERRRRQDKLLLPSLVVARSLRSIPARISTAAFSRVSCPAPPGITVTFFSVAFLTGIIIITGEPCSASVCASRLLASSMLFVFTFPPLILCPFRTAAAALLISSLVSAPS
ncbi:hypothetical protein SCA50_p28 (plasmid) [Salmonella enterica subsp. enterica serovar Choleraesuis str. SCSA50]|uniref:Uncharacterized protein n=3 Tax=Salmonella enterica subsp. enterica serovar Choleraesuis TaxID=119912 RepID=Q5J4A3_SALCH|nr:hypothetical protein SCH_V29 [Salmonella enterica subsp. enterica serovar Choleraesuis str. SC-B67]EFZ04568.1 hypothetical protein SCA50_p28 [Salmonella enterica subsp. enterica serovar Choleraesuis str. SCSA50]